MTNIEKISGSDLALIEARERRARADRIETIGLGIATPAMVAAGWCWMVALWPDRAMAADASGSSWAASNLLPLAFLALCIAAVLWSLRRPAEPIDWTGEDWTDEGRDTGLPRRQPDDPGDGYDRTPAWGKK